MFSSPLPLRRIFAGAASVLLIGAAQPPPFSASDQKLAVAALDRAADEGLGADAFGQARLAADLSSADPTRQRTGQAGLRKALIAYAQAEHGLRVAPASFPKDWAIRPPPYDPEPGLDAALAGGRLADWLGQQPPADANYQALVEAYRRYRALAQAGGWTVLAGTARAGDQGPAVDALRARLRAEDPATPAGPGPFDPGLTAAVKRAQARLGLEEDGVAGRATLAALNLSAADRAEQIALNLERRRWMPRALPAARAELNTAAASLSVLAPGAPPLSMRVIVGQPDKATPMFADAIKAVVLNPPWNVPEEIARKEIWPKIRKDPGYMAREGFVVKPDGHLQQLPGPRCALGTIKFDLSNPFGVYLHDTPARSLFAKPYRALSHGCMRLEQPNALAKRLVAGDPKWGGAAVDLALLTGRTERIALNPPLPIYVAYWSAFVDEAGTVQFRPDVYGWDAKLKAMIPADTRREEFSRGETTLQPK